MAGIVAEMRYRAEIDGLRSIAVIPVILFHGGVSFFSGGYVGVDVFFVISGYLITSIVLQEIDAGSFNIIDFYARRARRILPALFFITLVSLPFAWIWMLPDQFKDYTQSVAALTVFASNFLFWIESGYFATASELKPMLHTWSLAVEEQYYVVFPLILVAVWKRSVGTTIVILGIILFLSLAATEWGWRNAPSANFYLLPFRAWELMVGSLCAIWLLRRGGPSTLKSHAQLGSALGLGMIVYATFAFDGQTPFPSLYALVPVLGSALIICCATPETIVGRGLGSKGPVAIGLISYSAYLWHQPLFALARIERGMEPPHWVMWILCAASLMLASLTWKFVEGPFRRPRSRWTPKRVVILAGVSSIIVGLVGALLSVTQWQRSYFLDSIPPENRPLLSLIEGAREGHANAYDEPNGCKFFIEELTEEIHARLEKCYTQHGQAWAMTGDSHSRDVFNGMAPTLDRPFFVLIDQSECRPHIPLADCASGTLFETLMTYGSRFDQLLYVQAGFYLLLDAEGQNRNRRLFSAGLDIVDPQLDVAGIERVLKILREFNEFVPVTWIGPRLSPYIFKDQMLAKSCLQAPNQIRLRSGQREIFEELDSYLESKTVEAGLHYVSEMQAVDYDVATEIYGCAALYWSDSDHWSSAGEALFGPRVSRAVEAKLGIPTK